MFSCTESYGRAGAFLATETPSNWGRASLEAWDELLVEFEFSPSSNLVLSIGLLQQTITLQNQPFWRAS